MTEILAFSIGLLENSWKAAVLILAIFVLRYFLGKKIPPAWRFGIWLFVAIPLLFHFSFPASWSDFKLVPSGSELLGMAASIEPEGAKHLAWKATVTPQLSWFSRGILLFSATWFLGCGVMLTIFARQIAMCRRWIKQGKPVTDQRALLIFEDCCKRMKVKTWLLVAESPAISGPFLVGVIRPTLLLPRGLAQAASEAQLRTIFLHELAHLKRWDVWTSWLMSGLLVVHWFNPILWMAVRRMNADREEACDVMALETLSPPERIAYGHALLDIAEHFMAPRKTPGMVGLAETLEQMTGRLEMVEKAGTWKHRWKIVAGILFVLLAVVIVPDAQGKRNVTPHQNGKTFAGPVSCDPALCAPNWCQPQWCCPENMKLCLPTDCCE